MSEAQIVRVAWAGCSAQCVIIMMCWWEANNCVCARRMCVCACVYRWTLSYFIVCQLWGVCACVCASGQCFFMQVSMDFWGVRDLPVSITIKVCVCTMAACLQSLSALPVIFSNTNALFIITPSRGPPCLRFESHPGILWSQVKYSQLQHPPSLSEESFTRWQRADVSTLLHEPADVLT